jgi:hypothetical protein
MNEIDEKVFVEPPVLSSSSEDTKSDESKVTKDESKSLDDVVNELIKSDTRVGWPAQNPGLRILTHGWFFTSHTEVLQLLIGPDTGAVFQKSQAL